MPQAPGQAQPPQGPPQEGQRGPGGQGGQRAGGQRAPRPTVPPEFDGLPIWKMKAPELLAMLKDPKSTEFQKAIAMKKLSVVGGRDSIIPMAAYLNDPHLACYARFGMEPNPDPLVDEQFRAAVPKLKGRLKVGVITSIGVRKDARALDMLAKLIYDEDPEVACAAAASVGMIGGLRANTALQAALGKTKPPVFPVVARACLLVAETLTGVNRPRAIELYTLLSGPTMPEPVRLTALRNLNAAGPAPAGAKDYPPPTGAAAEADRSGFLGRGRQ